MINLESLETVGQAGFSSSFCRPLYGSFCFSRIPETIYSLLTAKKSGLELPSSCYPSLSEAYDLVILFFLDGFGWRFFEKYRSSHPFLERMVQQGYVSKITSQFPSTTAGHVTCIHSGLEVGQSGIYEWFQYEPLVDRIMAPLLFSYAGDKKHASLFSSKIPTELFFPFPNLYQKLHKQNVDCYLFQHESISHSPYSQTLTKGGHLVSFYTWEQAVEGIVEQMGSQDKPTYTFAYLADIDAAGHREGVESAAFEKAVFHCFDVLEQKLIPALSRTGKKVAMMITADHGMMEVNPKETIYIQKELPRDWIRKNRQGKPLVPAGSCRDFFLHIEPDKKEIAKSFLQKQLQGVAEVYAVEELIEKGFFGLHSPSSRFLERVGDLVILPLAKQAVWWYEKNRYEQHFYAVHGGLSREEMETIFLFLDSDSLRF